MFWSALGPRVGSAIAVSVTLAVWLAGPASSSAGASSWSIQPTPNPSGTGVLSSVSCATATACSAVGHSTPETSLVEQWNGTTWTIEPSPSWGAAVYPVLTGVSCTAANACTAVGSMKHIYCPSACNRGFKLVTGPMAMQFNGTGWSWVPTANPSPGLVGGLSGASCPSASACVAVGSSGSAGLAEAWNGTAWAIQSPFNPSGGGGGVSCPTTSFCIAVGGSFAEQWNGTAWAIQTTPTPSVGDLVGVSCAATVCTAVGSSGGKTLAERWNGKAWSVQTTPNPTGATSATLSAVSCPAANACIAVGSYIATAGKTTTLAEQWNGTTWTIQTTPSPSATDSVLSGVSCATTTACTGVGDSINASGTDVTLAERYSG